MINTFYDFLKNKDKIIKMKILKRIYLKQNGGGIKELQREIDRLKEIRGKIQKQLVMISKTEYDKIISEINEIMGSFDDLVTKEIKAEPNKLQLLRNQMEMIKGSMDNPDGVLNIKLEKLPNVIVAPPITEQFKFQFREILDAKETEMSEIIDNLKDRGDDENLFEGALETLSTYISETTQKLSELEQFNNTINEKIKEIKTYIDSKTEFEINPKYFKNVSELHGDDIISINKLEGMIHLEPDRAQSSIGEQLTKFSIDEIDPEKLVIPNFSDSSIFSGGSLYLFNISKDYKIDNVIDIIFLKWIETINENISKLNEIKERELRNIEEIFTINKEKLEETILGLNGKITSMKESLNRKKEIFFDSDCIVEIKKEFNDVIDTKLSIIKEMEKVLMNIMDKKNFDIINNILLRIENDLDKIKSELIKFLKNIIYKINEYKDYNSDENQTIKREIKENKTAIANIYQTIIENIFKDNTQYISFIDLYNDKYKSNKLKEQIIESTKNKNKKIILGLDNTIKLELINLYLTNITPIQRDYINILIQKINELNKTNETFENKIKTNKECDAEIQKYDPKEITQFGGTFRDDYNHSLITLQSKINDYKKLYNEFKKNIDKYNLLYIDLYHHQLFISSYIDLVLIKKNINIFQYISKGIVEYYLKGIKQITSKYKQEEPIIDYFRKNHSINLMILENFLQKLFDRWKQSNGDIIYKLVLIKNDEENKNYKFCVFLFNMYKNIIDDYITFYKPSVAVYLRINNNEQIANREVYFKKNDDKLLAQSLDLCSGIETEYKTKIEGMKFETIFDPDEFGNNDALSLYMGVSNFLKSGKSILIITYGYSGVGKTYTVFGKKGSSGLLQTSLISLGSNTQIKVKTFEIYGIALPYTSYWENKPTKDYDHKIYDYKYSDSPKEEIYTNTNMDKYLNEINNNFDDETSHIEISSKDINNFSEFIEKIDEIRTKQGRIKKTINNLVSSRSIMVYEFKVLLDDGKVVSFIIMDLPGKEDVLNTYVNNKLLNNYTNQSISLHNDRNSLSFGIQIKEKYTKDIDNDALKAAVFLNPMFISLFTTIAEDFIKFFKGKINTEDSDYKNFYTLSYGKNDKLLSTVLGPNGTISNIAGDKLTLAKCTEIFRYILLKNRLDILSDFYNDKLLDINEINMGKNYGAISLEAFYINENILGLIDVLKERLGDKSLKINQMEKYFEDNVKMKEYIENKKYLYLQLYQINNEIVKENENDKLNEASKLLGIAFIPTRSKLQEIISELNNWNDVKPESINEATQQTYFLRELIRNQEKKSYNNDHTNLANYDQIFSPYPKISNDVKLKDWVENAYDFNKTFTGSETKPPIKTFMKAYFGKNSEDKNTIDNIFLFYVVNNDKNKCSNQIKFISDSSDFVQIINNHKPK